MKKFLKTIIDPNWRPHDGPIPFMRNYGAAIVAIDLAIIIAILLRKIVGLSL
jgi:hypothetical protein